MLEATELLRSREPPLGSVLAALRRTESSLTHGTGSETSIPLIGGGDIFPLAHGPQYPKRKLSWLKKINLPEKLRTDERAKTRRERKTHNIAATASALTYTTHPTQLTLLEHHLQPPPPRP